MVRLGQMRQPRRPKVHVAARAQSGDSKFSDKQRVCSKRRNVSGALRHCSCKSAGAASPGPVRVEAALWFFSREVAARYSVERGVELPSHTHRRFR